MQPGEHPEAIDTRLVFRIYAWSAATIGTIIYLWPVILPTALSEPMQLAGMPPEARFALVRVLAAAIAGLGCCAAGSAAVNDPLGRLRGLQWFALGHVFFGVMFLLQWSAIFSLALPPVVGWAPLIVGLILLYLALTGPGLERRPTLPPPRVGAAPGELTFAVRNKRSLRSLRSQYEEQIRQAARQEERARLARDLHDAVKQQLFVIQTAAATVQARLDTDTSGARAAVEQVRSSAREAMTEMEAMLQQLQAAPIENTGLVALLKQQCEALGFRTGAQVNLELGELPPDTTLAPGARQTIVRVAQEALSNVARHARAQHVRVSLGLAGGGLALTVDDDGSGFSKGEGPRGMGMSNMAVRAAEIGGHLEVTGTPDRGTSLRFWVPYDSPSARQYATRAAAWGVVLILTAVYAAAVGLGERPWAAAIAIIAGIALLRYATAGYRVWNPRTTI